MKKYSTIIFDLFDTIVNFNFNHLPTIELKGLRSRTTSTEVFEVFRQYYPEVEFEEFYDPFIEQVSVYSASGAITNTPILLLANSDQALWQNYEVKLIKPNHYLIKSKDSNSQVKSLELVFAHGEKTTHKKSAEKLNEFVILDATGQRSRVKLSNVVALTNAQQTELFIFKTPAGVDIDDQR